MQVCHGAGAQKVIHQQLKGNADDHQSQQEQYGNGGKGSAEGGSHKSLHLNYYKSIGYYNPTGAKMQETGKWLAFTLGIWYANGSTDL
jgi:hypothetical protein